MSSVLSIALSQFLSASFDRQYCFTICNLSAVTKTMLSIAYTSSPCKLVYASKVKNIAASFLG